MSTADLRLPEDLERSLRVAVNKIVEIADPELVILFGSHAEGHARPDSDVDLLVVAETEERLRLAAALRRALAEALAPRKFDLIVIPAADWPKYRRIRGFITHEADQYGVKCYERAA